MRTLFQLQPSTCSRTVCNAFVSSRQAFTRTFSVPQASWPHLEEVNLLPGAAALGNSPGMTIKTSTHKQTKVDLIVQTVCIVCNYGVFEIGLVDYIWLHATLCTHASNNTAGVREFGQFDPHRQLGQLLQYSVQRVSTTLNIAVNHRLISWAQSSAVVRYAELFLQRKR